MKDKLNYKIRNQVDIPIQINGVKNTGTFFTFKNTMRADDDEIKKEHIAIGLGNWHQKTPIIRLHSECFTGDVFNSMRCDCRDQLEEAKRLISERGGFIIYLKQEGRGIGLYNKIDAYELQIKGYDTFEANKHLGFENDLRNFSVAADIIKALGFKKIILHTNNPDKKSQLERDGIEVISLINTKCYLKNENENYLKTKKNKSKHQINFK